MPRQPVPLLTKVCTICLNLHAITCFLSSLAPHGNSGVAIAVITGSVSGCIAVLFGVLLFVYCKCRKTRVLKKSIEAAAPPPLPYKGNIVVLHHLVLQCHIYSVELFLSSL